MKHVVVVEGAEEWLLVQALEKQRYNYTLVKF
jgi:hypothetical protein